jgi:broad specificity phosphatase PhoE
MKASHWLGGLQRVNLNALTVHSIPTGRHMPDLILIRHSTPEIVPGQPAHTWVLSEEGRQRCLPFAEKLAAYRPQIMATSVEPKAIETGQIIAERLNIACRTAENLHEHERHDVPFFDSKPAFDDLVRTFEALVRDFFNHPDELVFGNETADQCYKRYSAAVEALVETYQDQTIAVVSHGTVMSLFVARKAGVDPYPFWQALNMPDFVVLSLPQFSLRTLSTC